MKLRNKISIFFIIMITVLVFLIRFMVVSHLSQTLENQISSSALDVANIVSQNKKIQYALYEENDFEIQREIELFRDKTRFQYIIVLDRNSIQYSHPNESEIGKKYSRGGEYEVLKYGKSYALTSSGNIFSNIRAFVPIYLNKEQVGAVLVATVNDSVNKEVKGYENELKFLFISILFLGIVGSGILTVSIKKQIFGLEPYEIAELLYEKDRAANLAKELNNSREVIENIRAQNHEFQNKLHTISGLIQLEEHQKALEYIDMVASDRADFFNNITNKIIHPHVAAILLSKYNKALENKISFHIDEESNLKELPATLSEDDITSIIGNLLENSIEELSNVENGVLSIKLNSDNKKVNIIIKDNGRGIDESIIGNIFSKGFTNKEGQRGYGLWIVKTLIEKSGGTIRLSSNDGVTWDISIPIEKGGTL